MNATTSSPARRGTVLLDPFPGASGLPLPRCDAGCGLSIIEVRPPRGRPELTSWAIVRPPARAAANLTGGAGYVIAYALTPADALRALEALASCAPWQQRGGRVTPLEMARIDAARSATGTLSPADWRRWRLFATTTGEDAA